MGYPVLDDGHDFHRVDVFAGQKQAAVFQTAHGFLVGQQGAAGKVGGGAGGDADDDFADVIAVVKAVGLVDGLREAAVKQKGVGLFLRLADLAEAEGFLFAVVKADEIPDAVFVDEPVGFDAVVFDAAVAFCVGEGKGIALVDGLGNQVKLVLPRFDVFVLEAFDGNALGEFVEKEAAVGFGKEILDAGETAEAFDFVAAEQAVSAGVETVVAAFGAFCEFAQAVDVALDGAQGDAVLVAQLVDIERFAAVKAGEQLNQAGGDDFAAGRFFAGGHCFALLGLEYRQFKQGARQLVSRCAGDGILFCCGLFFYGFIFLDCRSRARYPAARNFNILPFFVNVFYLLRFVAVRPVKGSLKKYRVFRLLLPFARRRRFFRTESR